MTDLLPIVTCLSSALQASSIDLSQLHQLVGSTVQSLELLHVTPGPQLSKLDSDLGDSLSQFAININSDMKRKKQFHDQILTPFIDALLSHIKEHLPDTGVFAAFSVFEPSKLPATAEEAALQKYGEVEVKVLNKQYGGDSDAALIHSSALEGEWYDLRSYLYLSCRTMSMGDVLNLLATNTTLHCTLSNFTKLALVCPCLPLTTTDCERAFPTMCRVKTRLRGQMINKTLNHWHENIDFPLEEFDFNVAVEKWSHLN